MKDRKPSADYLRLIPSPEAAADPEKPDTPRPDQPKRRPAPAIKAPAGLSKRAKAEYVRAATELVRTAKWSVLFVQPLAAYAASWDRWLQARGRLKKLDDLVVLTPNGYPVQSPWYTIANKERDFMLRIAGDLGFTVVSQARVVDLQLDLFGAAPPADDNGAEKTGTNDPFEGF